MPWIGIVHFGTILLAMAVGMVLIASFFSFWPACAGKISPNLVSGSGEVHHHFVRLSRLVYRLLEPASITSSEQMRSASKLASRDGSIHFG
jgi:hypothetical protein